MVASRFRRSVTFELHERGTVAHVDNPGPHHRVRIAFVDGNVDSLYGGQRRMLVLAQALAPEHDVTIVTTREGRLAEAARLAGVRVQILSAHERVNRFGGSIVRDGTLDKLRTARHVLNWSIRFAYWARLNRVQVVVANDLRSCLMCGWGARVARVPVIWTVRDDVRNGRLHTLGSYLANCVVTVSNGARSAFTEAERRRLGARLRTIHNGVPLQPVESYDASRLRSLVGPNVRSEDRVIAIVGMVTPRKGHEDAVAALARLRSHHNIAAHLVVIGDAPAGYESYHARLESVIEQAGLASAVTWLGFAPNAVELMRGADLVILPSRNEGLPGVLIESLGVGTPAVTYACSGADEIVQHGVTGSVVPVGDIDALAGAIAEWLSNPQRMRTAGALGVDDMRRRFSVDAYAAAYRTLLEGFARRPHNGTGAA